MDSTIIRTCKNCNNTDEYTVTKTEAAFWLKDNLIRNKKCTKCGSSEASSMEHPALKLDRELLDIWGADPKLYFIDQDEEIILAEEENLALFVEAIDNKLYPQSKLNILLAAICILAYDNIVEPEEYTATENAHRKVTANKAINELIKKKHLLTTLTWEIMDYVKEVVFPRLDIKHQ